MRLCPVRVVQVVAEPGTECSETRCADLVAKRVDIGIETHHHRWKAAITPLRMYWSVI